MYLIFKASDTRIKSYMFRVSNVLRACKSACNVPHHASAVPRDTFSRMLYQVWIFLSNSKLSFILFANSCQWWSRTVALHIYIYIRFVLGTDAEFTMYYNTVRSCFYLIKVLFSIKYESATLMEYDASRKPLLQSWYTIIISYIFNSWKWLIYFIFVIIE